MTAKPPIEFYFDFISPFGYLAASKIDELAARYGRETRWQAMMLGITVMKVMGLKPLLDTPLKGDYVRHDVPRLARHFGVPLKMIDDVPSPLAAARAFYWLDDRDPALAKKLAQRLYPRLFARGEDISSPDSVAEEAQALGVSRAETLAALQDDKVKQRLHQAVESSIAKGVFGSPFFIVDGEPIWGCDRLWMVEKMLQEGRL
jgi:2-hydroxychromene-2-carboxylate isomerase